MRALIKITLALGVLYGGYWAVGAQAMRSGLVEALEDLRAKGVAEYSDLKLVGFPSRFDVTVTDPALTTPDGLVDWRAPFVQVFALSYRPNHVIAVWPPTQSLRVGPQTIGIASEDLRASAVFGVAATLPLERTSLVGTTVTLRSDAGWALDMPEARFATQRAEDGGDAHRIGVEVLGAKPSGALKARIDPEGRLPEAVDWFRLDAVATLDRPIELLAAAAGEPRLEGLELQALSLGWGDVKLEAAGGFTVGADGVPVGRFTLSARNWREVLRLAVAAGVLDPGMAPSLERGFEQVALAAGDAELLELPLILAGGWVSLGPLPLGPAPRF